MNLKIKANIYFRLFASKNINKLKDIFDQKIILKDWKAKINGKKNVINFNEKTFKNFDVIKVKVLETFVNSKKNSIACKIVINLDKLKLNVVDIIYFNKKGNISKIEAYKL